MRAKLLTLAFLLAFVGVCTGVSIVGAAGPPYATIRVKSFRLDPETDGRLIDKNGEYIPCSQGNTAYGCGFTLVGGEYVPGYPYSDSVAVLDIEADYLPNVVPFETNPADGFNATALRVQAVAARTYSYHHSDNPVSASYDLNNSAEKQYFQVNGRFAMRPAHSQSDAAVLATSGYYIATTNHRAIFAEFGADHDPNNETVEYQAPPFYTNPGGAFYLKSVFDPITNGEDDNIKGAGHGRGVSQQGAKKWGAGLSTGGVYFPKWDFTKVLAHYYTNINMYTPNGAGGLDPAWGPYRWNMVEYSPSNPGEIYYENRSKTINMTVQNSGTVAWESGTRLRYCWQRVSEAGTTCTVWFTAVASLPQLNPGDSQALSAFTITPPSGVYTTASCCSYQIVWDVQRPGGTFFSAQGWLTQEWAIKLRKPVTAPQPPTPPCHEPPCALNVQENIVQWLAIDHPEAVTYRWRHQNYDGDFTDTVVGTQVSLQLEPGTNDVYVKAFETAESSNSSDEVLVFHALYDPYPPALSTNDLPSWTNLTQVMLTWSATDPDNGGVDGSGVQDFTIEQQVNGGGWATLLSQPQAGEYTVTGLVDGNDYAFKVTARDVAGNISQQTLTTRVDRTAPTSQVTSPSGSISKTWAVLHWSGSDDRSGIVGYILDLQINGGAWQQWRVYPGATTASIFEGDANTNYAFRIRAIDAAENTEAAHSTADITFTTGTDASGLSKEWQPLFLINQ